MAKIKMIHRSVYFTQEELDEVEAARDIECMSKTSPWLKQIILKNVRRINEREERRLAHYE